MLVWTSLVAPLRRRTMISGGGAVLGALFYLHLARFYGWSLLWILGGLVVAALVLRSLGSALWAWSRQPFAECDLGLMEVAAPGGFVRAVVRVEARRPIRIRRATARLVLESRTTDGETRQSCRVECALSLGHRLDPGQRAEAEVALPVPEDAPFSFRSFGSEARIRCLVRVRLETAPPGEPPDATDDGFPPVDQEIEVLIAPGSEPQERSRTMIAS